MLSPFAGGQLASASSAECRHFCILGFGRVARVRCWRAFALYFFLLFSRTLSSLISIIIQTKRSKRQVARQSQWPNRRQNSSRMPPHASRGKRQVIRHNWNNSSKTVGKRFPHLESTLPMRASRSPPRADFTSPPPLTSAVLSTTPHHSPDLWLTRTPSALRLGLTGSGGMKTLLFVTTQMSKDHFNCLSCWPHMLGRLNKLRGADILIDARARSLVSEGMKKAWNSVAQQLPNPRVSITFASGNPGYQQGAMISMYEAFRNGSFQGYDWVVRLNPDVLFFEEDNFFGLAANESVHGIFANCCFRVPNCTVSLSSAAPGIWKGLQSGHSRCGDHGIPVRIHTDWFAFRPERLQKTFFHDYRKWPISENYATFEFRDILRSGHHAWLSPEFTGGCGCRMGGPDVYHAHRGAAAGNCTQSSTGGHLHDRFCGRNTCRASWKAVGGSRPVLDAILPTDV